MTEAPARCRYCGDVTYISDFDGPAHPCCKTAFHAGYKVCGSCHRAIHPPGQLPSPRTGLEGKVGRYHPSTSVRAAKLAIPRAGSQRAAILDHLARVYPDGMTAFELAPLIGRSPNQTATRLLELREQGWVDYLEKDGQRVERPTTRGNTGLVQRLTPEAAKILL